MEWSRSGNKYIHGARVAVPCLPLGVFRVDQDQRDRSLFLVHVQDKFPLPEKIYGMDTKLITQVCAAYRSGILSKNLGILLAGVKGTGKTIAAKQLCNEIGLPVLLVHNAYDDAIPQFLNDIRQDVVVFIDEYEKIYEQDEDEAGLLSVMDGAMDNGFKRVFILTANNLSVSPNLIDRPSRVRYLKRYSDLDITTIEEVVDDLLKFRDLRADVIEFISDLNIITIDVVKSLLDEVNICGQPPATFKDIFNVSTSAPACNLYDITPAADGTTRKEVIIRNVCMHSFKPTAVGHEFKIDGRVIGKITKVLAKRCVEVVTKATETTAEIKRVYLYKKCKKIHKAFVSKKDDRHKYEGYKSGSDSSVEDEDDYIDYKLPPSAWSKKPDTWPDVE